MDLRDNSPQLDGLAAYTSMGVGVAAGLQTERVIAELVTANYFPLLGVDMPLGPGFAGADELGGAAPVAVISPRLWQSMFNGDGSVIGRTLQVNGLAARVVGVTPPSFSGFTRGRRVDVWMTVNQYFILDRSRDRLGSRETSWLSLVGRTRPGAAVAQAQAQMTATLHAKEIADGTEWSIRTSRAGAGDTSLVDDLDRPLRLLLLVVGLILVIASANVANLLLTRAYTRQREIAMRTALGASRARIVRQLLIEGAVLSSAGGAVGLFLGVWTAAVFDLRTARGSALVLTMEPDVAVVAFTAAVSALAAVAIGILPALGASRVDLVSVLKGSGEAVSGVAGKRRARTTLTLVQIALALVLVLGAGLFLRSLGKLRAIDPSLATDRVIASELDLTLRGYDEGQGRQFYSRDARGRSGAAGRSGGDADQRAAGHRRRHAGEPARRRDRAEGGRAGGVRHRDGVARLLRDDGRAAGQRAGLRACRRRRRAARRDRQRIDAAPVLAGRRSRRPDVQRRRSGARTPSSASPATRSIATCVKSRGWCCICRSGRPTGRP